MSGSIQEPKAAKLINRRYQNHNNGTNKKKLINIFDWYVYKSVIDWSFVLNLKKQGLNDKASCMSTNNEKILLYPEVTIQLIRSLVARASQKYNCVDAWLIVRVKTRV